MINKDKYYKIEELSKMEILPWNNYRSILKHIQFQITIGNQKKYEIIVKPSISVDSAVAKFGNRYFIKGSGIIKLLKSFEEGTLYVL